MSDHTPTAGFAAVLCGRWICAVRNLRAWCQRCHNTYDGPARRAGIRARAFAAQLELDLG